MGARSCGRRRAETIYWSKKGKELTWVSTCHLVGCLFFKNKNADHQC